MPSNPNITFLCSPHQADLWPHKYTHSPAQPNLRKRRYVKYNKGSYTFSTTTYFNTSTTTLNPLTFTLTFTNRTQTTTNYNFGYTIQEINYFITNSKINYSLIINGTKAATSIQAMFFTNNANQINIFKINYVII